ncbi:MAG: DUF4292 domain-containing protein [Spirosomataceae bacterium]
MKINLSFSLGLFLIILFAACHRQRQKSGIKPVKDSLIVNIDTLASIPQRDSITSISTEPEEIKIKVEDVDFEYLTAKSKISFKSKEQDIDNANVSIRMKKDSVLWLQVVVGPIEVMRGLITRDSIRIVDRYNKAYYLYDFTTLSKQFNFQLSFDLIQSILVGNMPIPKTNGQRFRKEKDFFMLRQEEGKISIENYIGEQNRRLKKLMVTEQPTKNSLTLDYEDFTQLNNYLFPYTSLIQLDYESKEDKLRYQTVFKIKHQKVELSEKPLTFPFGIPSKFERK